MTRERVRGRLWLDLGIKHEELFLQAGEFTFDWEGLLTKKQDSTGKEIKKGKGGGEKGKQKFCF